MLCQKKKIKEKNMKAKQIKSFQEKEQRDHKYILQCNNHLDIIFAEVITRNILVTLAKPSAIAVCQGEV